MRQPHRSLSSGGEGQGRGWVERGSVLEMGESSQGAGEGVLGGKRFHGGDGRAGSGSMKDDVGGGEVRRRVGFDALRGGVGGTC